MSLMRFLPILAASTFGILLALGGYTSESYCRDVRLPTTVYFAARRGVATGVVCLEIIRGPPRNRAPTHLNLHGTPC